jgi:dTMP kinase
LFIAIDGVDGTGKSTQIRLLVEHLAAAGHPVLAVRDPGTTVAGEAIRKLVLDSDLEMHRRCEALLYMAARSQLVEEKIRPALAAGTWVVSDRYLLANVVYQSVGGSESTDMLWRLGEIAVAGVRPDLTILLDMPAKLAMQRIDRPADRMESRGIDYLESVRQAFLTQVAHSGSRYVIIDATQSIEAMQSELVASLRENRS